MPKSLKMERLLAQKEIWLASRGSGVYPSIAILLDFPKLARLYIRVPEGERMDEAEEAFGRGRGA